MKTFTICQNNYLNQNVSAFYSTDYLGYRYPGNPDYINTLKNTFDSYSETSLRAAQTQLFYVLQEDIPQIIKEIGVPDLTICVIPRSKSENTYSQNQLLFKETVRTISYIANCTDGTDYIVRTIDTKTTHLQYAKISLPNDGARPYVGITADTCSLSPEIEGKNILLIDDIYTKTVNIDEDCLQTLLNKGAKSVYFYAVAKTILK